MRTPSLAAAALLALVAAPPAAAWDCHGHRTIALLAQEGFAQTVASGGTAPAADGASRSGGLPAWLTSDRARAMAAYQACEPDRYRAVRIPYMGHENNLEHYLDLEDLEPFGLTLDTVPPFRYEYMRALAIGKHEHPENFEDRPPINPKADPTATLEWPGFALHSAMEHYAKLVSAFRTVRTLEAIADPRRDDAGQLEAARANVFAEMGHLAHVVGDLAQPLHTTRHHHGWVGDNPRGFTTDRKIHSYIDGDVLDLHRLDEDAVRPACRFDRAVADPSDPWREMVEHTRRSFDKVAPLYELEKAGELPREEGKRFITERLADGASTLAAMYAAAWRASALTDQSVPDFIKYDRFEGVKAPPRDRD